MTEAKSTHQVRRGRIFPEIQWTQEQQSQWKAEREALKERCKLIFHQVQAELLKTHYNWYMAVEPESGEYFINEDILLVGKQAHEKYPNAKLHVFRINETGISGKI
ncbi:hypothetical protein [Nostoc parmelioides]|uniref:YolD-like family protein n=1 Tax=Nostoc parmelioides FACHB-3921 TaxID=2692909 RepID=A0ABR8BAD8_9NOSO|nr:hypothetical protein [Nostoc parmelioides]MBD2249907.1 hypothetical protein [Nostoc parmelioides FACHB-3921]